MNIKGQIPLRVAHTFYIKSKNVVNVHVCTHNYTHVLHTCKCVHTKIQTHIHTQQSTFTNIDKITHTESGNILAHTISAAPGNTQLMQWPSELLH